MPKRQNQGSWVVDIRPDGAKGKRIRKSFKSHGEANRFESYILGQSAQGKPWNSKPPDSRRLSELINIWYQNHGQYLRDGKRRLKVLEAITASLSDPIACNMIGDDFLKYRRTKKGVGEKPINPKTLNNHQGYLNAVFNECYKTGIIDYQNPLERVRPIKIAERELSYLTTDQIRELFDTIKGFSINPHVLLLTKLCLSTGCRWGEAESLTITRVKNESVTFTGTKSGKNRTVPISKDLEKEIVDHHKEKGKGENIFSSSMKAFDRVIKQLSFTLPPGQSTHVLRHTFASHFIMNGGDLLTLQKILGHSTINMTMRYSHLSNEHLAKSITLNPISRIKLDISK